MLTILGITVAGSFVFGWLSGRNSIHDLLNGMYDDEQLRDAQRDLRVTVDHYEDKITELNQRLDNSGWRDGWQACEQFHKEVDPIDADIRRAITTAKSLELQADLATAS